MANDKYYLSLTAKEIEDKLKKEHTTIVNENSTDQEIPTAKAVWDSLPLKDGYIDQDLHLTGKNAIFFDDDRVAMAAWQEYDDDNGEPQLYAAVAGFTDENSALPVRILNVAPGIEDNDAVTVGQLKELNSGSDDYVIKINAKIKRADESEVHDFVCSDKVSYNYEEAVAAAKKGKAYIECNFTFNDISISTITYRVSLMNLDKSTPRLTFSDYGMSLMMDGYAYNNIGYIDQYYYRILFYKIGAGTDTSLSIKHMPADAKAVGEKVPIIITMYQPIDVVRNKLAYSRVITNQPAVLHIFEPQERWAYLSYWGGINDDRYYFTCYENGTVYHYILDTSRWSTYTQNVQSDLQSISNIANTAKHDFDTFKAHEYPILAKKAFNNFKCRMMEQGGSMTIKKPGIYLFLQGGTNNKKILIKDANGDTVLDATWNGIMILASDEGNITPMGIKPGLSLGNNFATPGTFHGWTPNGEYPATTITYPADCVIWKMGNDMSL